jgi:hypothetical protein
MTSDRCPDCEQIIYMVVYPKLNNAGEPILSQLLWRGHPHTVADGCYVDQEGLLVIGTFDEETLMPDFYCLHCRWEG